MGSKLWMIWSLRSPGTMFRFYRFSAPCTCKRSGGACTKERGQKGSACRWGSPKDHFLFDSAVIVVAVGKGRSSSYLHNGVLRSLMVYAILGRIEVALIWIGTKINPGDYPSRFQPLTLPRPMSTAARSFFGPIWSSGGAGLEISAGACGLTKAFRQRSLRMCDPLMCVMVLSMMSWILMLSRVFLENRRWQCFLCDHLFPASVIQLPGAVRKVASFDP